MAAGNVEFISDREERPRSLIRRGYKVIGDFTTVFGKLSFDTVRVAAEMAMERFPHGYYDQVDIVYNEFKNVATQIIRTGAILTDRRETERCGGNNQQHPGLYF